MPFFGTVIHWFFSWFPARSQASKNSVCTTQFYTKNCLHKTIVTQNNFYICLQNYKTQPLQRTTYTEHDFYTKQRFRKTGFTWTAVTQHKFYTKNRLYTQRNLYSTQRVSGPLGVSARYTFVFMFVSWYWGVASQAKWPGENMVGWELERKKHVMGKIKIWMELCFFCKPMMQCSKTKFNHPQDCKTLFGLCRRPTSARWNMTQAGDLQIFAVADSFMMVMYRGILCVQIGSQNEWFTCK